MGKFEKGKRPVSAYNSQMPAAERNNLYGQKDAQKDAPKKAPKPDDGYEMIDEEEEALEEDKMSITGHLAELRSRLIWCIGAFVVAFGISLWQASPCSITFCIASKQLASSASWSMCITSVNRSSTTSPPTTASVWTSS